MKKELICAAFILLGCCLFEASLASSPNSGEKVDFLDWAKAGAPDTREEYWERTGSMQRTNSALTPDGKHRERGTNRNVPKYEGNMSPQGGDGPDRKMTSSTVNLRGESDRASVNGQSSLIKEGEASNTRVNRGRDRQNTNKEINNLTPRNSHISGRSSTRSIAELSDLSVESILSPGRSSRQFAVTKNSKGKLRNADTQTELGEERIIDLDKTVSELTADNTNLNRKYNELKRRKEHYKSALGEVGKQKEQAERELLRYKWKGLASQALNRDKLHKISGEYREKVKGVEGELVNLQNELDGVNRENEAYRSKLEEAEAEKTYEYEKTVMLKKYMNDTKKQLLLLQNDYKECRDENDQLKKDNKKLQEALKIAASVIETLTSTAKQSSAVGKNSGHAGDNGLEGMGLGKLKPLIDVVTFVNGLKKLAQASGATDAGNNQVNDNENDAK